MNLLLTGGAGYVGSHAAKALARAGHTVTVLDNLSRGHRWAVRWGALEVADLLDTAAVQDILRRHGIDAVLHFAALAYVGESVQFPERYFRNNVQGSLSLLDAMRQAGVRTLIFSSTCATYGIPETIPIAEDAPQKPSNPYGESKLMVEKLLYWENACHGLRWVALRYFNAAGCDPDGEIGEWHQPETHLIPSLLGAALGTRGPCPLYGDDYPTPDGTCIRDYVHVADLAEAHLLALNYLQRGEPSKAFNLGTGRGYSVRQILREAEKVTGRDIAVELLLRRAGDPPELIAAPGAAGTALGWIPRHSSLSEILSTAWEWQAFQASTVLQTV